MRFGVILPVANNPIAITQQNVLMLELVSAPLASALAKKWVRDPDSLYSRESIVEVTAVMSPHIAIGTARSQPGRIVAEHSTACRLQPAAATPAIIIAQGRNPEALRCG